jgi:serine/threonine-protein kinase RsbW
MATRTFTAVAENLAIICEFISREAKSAGLDEHEIYAVQLAVDEACSNIIEHAYTDNDLGEIQLDCTPIENGLKIVLNDQGAPFNPDTIPEPVVGVPLEEYGPRGAGLFLMRKMMDEVKFDFKSDVGTVLTMIKRKKKP